VRINRGRRRTRRPPTCFWYVKADSPIKTLRRYRRQGPSRFSGQGAPRPTASWTALHEAVRGSRPFRTATGRDRPPTLIQVIVPGRSTVGWSAPPFGLEPDRPEQDSRHCHRQMMPAAFKGQTVAAPDRQPAGPAGAARRPPSSGICKPYREDVGLGIFRPGPCSSTMRRGSTSPACRPRQRNARRLLPQGRRSIPTGSWGWIRSSTDGRRIEIHPGRPLDQGAARRTDFRSPRR